MGEQKRSEALASKKKTGDQNPLITILGASGLLYYVGEWGGLWHLHGKAQNALVLFLLGGMGLVLFTTTLQRKNSHSSENATAIPEDSNDEHR